MTDLPFRKILGLNQQTYQRLRIALSLNLRRQIFVAVCDDLVLRDRLAAQLVNELTPSPSKAQRGQNKTSTNRIRYPRLVSLHLNLSDPDPINQAAQWLSQSPPPPIGSRYAPMPAFQILGIEQLTRQPASMQRLFFTHLQDIERSLPVLESSLLLWVPQPWFHALPHSAPEFWRCRTAVFEFVGDPTPLPPPANDSFIHIQPQRPSSPPNGGRLDSSNSEPAEPVKAEELPPPSPSIPQDELWTILVRDLAQLDPPDPDEPAPTGDSDDAASDIRLSHHRVPQLTNAPIQVAEAPPQVATKAVSQRPAVALVDDEFEQLSQTVAAPPAKEKAAAQLHVVAKPAESKAAVTVKEPAVSLQPVVAQPVLTADPSDPVALVQQIEALHAQQAPPTALADAYRLLGNLYRDRIEQGDVSSQNLSTAIQSYEQVLVWLHETSPLWTDVLNDLGNLYWMVSRYDATPEQSLSHLQQGIQAYQLALTKLNFQTQTHAYPMIQNNLGAAYADLARYQDPAENLQRSVQAYEQALRYRKAETDPQRYASTQNNLGTTYWNLAQHTQPELYLKQAIAAYSEALHYYSPEQEPLSYAMIQNNLGTAYWNLAQHERPQDWLRLALGAYKIALKYRTLEAVPASFAATQNNLGTAHWHLANHTKDNPDLRLDYLRQAIDAYETTLLAAERLSNSAQPVPLNFDLFATHNNLALAHYQIATDVQIVLDAKTHSAHLEVALDHHLQALQGWQQKPEFRQTALNCIIQTIRALYSQCGLSGQNLALSKVPGYLLPEILPKL